MNEFEHLAQEKLREQLQTVIGQREKAMAPLVAEKLGEFCGQSEVFAQAVVTGGTFKECMAAVAKDVGNYISDIDAYKKAVAFYFPNATVTMQLTIQTQGADIQQPNKPVVLQLLDFI